MNDQDKLKKLKRESLRVWYGYGPYTGQTIDEYVRRCHILRSKIEEVQARLHK